MYAIAKFAGMNLCESFNRQYDRHYVGVMPITLCGPDESYDLNNSHVPSALLRKAYEAKQSGDASVTGWGSGRPMREFLHVDDAAHARTFPMEPAEVIVETVWFEGETVFDTSRPDGTRRKLLDVSRMAALGSRARTSLNQVLAQTFAAYLVGAASAR